MKRVKFPRHPRVREIFAKYVVKKISSDLYARALIGWHISLSTTQLEGKPHSMEITKLLNDEKYRREQLSSWLETFKEDYLYENELYAKLVEQDIQYLKTA